VGRLTIITAVYSHYFTEKVCLMSDRVKELEAELEQLGRKFHGELLTQSYTEIGKAVMTLLTATAYVKVLQTVDTLIQPISGIMGCFPEPPALPEELRASHYRAKSELQRCKARQSLERYPEYRNNPDFVAYCNGTQQEPDDNCSTAQTPQNSTSVPVQSQESQCLAPDPSATSG